jgi:hypothetical protein
MLLTLTVGIMLAANLNVIVGARRMSSPMASFRRQTIFVLELHPSCLTHAKKRQK